MTKDYFMSVVYIVSLFIALLIFSFLFFTILFFFTVSFTGPVTRFATDVLLNIVVVYYFLHLFRFIKKTRLLLSVIPPIICVLFFVGLGIMQNSN